MKRYYIANYAKFIKNLIMIAFKKTSFFLAFLSNPGNKLRIPQFVEFISDRGNKLRNPQFVGQHLQFRGFVTLKHKEHFGNVGASKLSNDCKYILIYQKKGVDQDFHTSLKGVIEGAGMVKENHEYEQNVSDLDNLIDAISKPGDRILDMFAGSGTTGVAAIQKGRKITLIEKMEVHYKTSRNRLSEALKQREKLLRQTPSLSESCLRLADKVTDESVDIPVAM